MPKLTFVEWIIVGAIIGILAAIVIPNLDRANRIAGEQRGRELELAPGVYKVQDASNGVTCYYYGAGGISCVK